MWSTRWLSIDLLKPRLTVAVLSVTTSIWLNRSLIFIYLVVPNNPNISLYYNNKIKKVSVLIRRTRHSIYKRPMGCFLFLVFDINLVCYGISTLCIHKVSYSVSALLQWGLELKAARRWKLESTFSSRRLNTNQAFIKDH